MAENQIFFAHSETMRSHRPEALDYFLAASLHASERCDQKMAYYHWLLEESVIPGITRIAANDHFHPETMPTFPDPWYYEWNCWDRRKQRLQELFPQTA
jgi:hypothetical protein